MPAKPRLGCGRIEERRFTRVSKVVRAIRADIDGKPLKTEDYEFPTVYHGLRGMQFIYSAVESCEKGSTWVKM